ncbi:MAG: hypothetical protein DBY35_11405 [Bacteroidales bacterium]|nr:MAG: hypothetical protein DBY35_11405 [Bacteroidales bacterium]
MYGQIISFLFVILIIYYVVMILLDLQKAKAAKAAELEKNSEEEIDISDEANTFKPVLITRDDQNKTAIQETTENPRDSSEDKKKVPEKTEANEIAAADKEPEANVDDTTQPPQKPISEDKGTMVDSKLSKENEGKEAQQPPTPEKLFRREGYREAAMTGFLVADDILDYVDRFTETGSGPLAQVILQCHNTHF